MDTVLSFDDVLLIPQQTYGGSRDEVDLSTSISGWDYKIPIISANMSSVTEFAMIEAMDNLGGFGILHRMSPLEEINKLEEDYNFFHPVIPWISIEGSDLGITRFKNTDFHIRGVCIDVAHADSPTVRDTVVELRRYSPIIPLIVGNYATPDGIYRLLWRLEKENLNTNRISFKVGIGSGSMCSTRIVTGCGLPTLESIFRIKNYFEDTQISIIADGGFKNSGDIVKAIAAGADAVMLGNLLAGTEETPGNVIKHQGQLYKVYRGSASYGQKNEALGHIRYIEGEEVLVPYKGSVYHIIEQLVEGVKSGFSYCGARNIKELRENAEFVRITENGFKESRPHGVK